MRPLSSSC